MNLLLDGEKELLIARQQIPFLTEERFDYTGSGLFVRFSHSTEIEQFRIEHQNLMLDGVKIETSEFPIEAEATLFFTDGIIDYLEIWCYLGNYPSKELTVYTLSQKWKNSPNKTVSTESETTTK